MSNLRYRFFSFLNLVGFWSGFPSVIPAKAGIQSFKIVGFLSEAQSRLQRDGRILDSITNYEFQITSLISLSHLLLFHYCIKSENSRILLSITNDELRITSLISLFHLSLFHYCIKSGFGRVFLQNKKSYFAHLTSIKYNNRVNVKKGYVPY